MNTLVTLKSKACTLGTWDRIGDTADMPRLCMAPENACGLKHFIIAAHVHYRPASVRATAVGRDAERNAVLAGDPKRLDYYVILL